MAPEIIYRPARPADAFSLAELLILAGDGMYAFLLEDFAPTDMLAGLIARSIQQDSAGTSWRQCFVAEHMGEIAGMIQAYPAALLRDEERDVLPPDRVQVLDPIDKAQDWQSFLVSGVAVRSPHRRQHIGSRLLTWAVEEAQQGGFARVTANVWQDNVAAYALFAAHGFQVARTIELPPHPALQHVGASLLLVKEVKPSGA